MKVTIREEPLTFLQAYQTISIAFMVESIYRLPSFDPTGETAVWQETAVSPTLKDYDSAEPIAWDSRWDLSNWGLFGAYVDDTLVGCTAVAFNTPDVNMLEGRSDLAVLWDIRVSPDYRGRGIGRRLFETAVSWSRAQNAVGLKIETQNINVPACNFYQRQGCILKEINPNAYPDLPNEIQLIWYLKIDNES